MSIFLSTVGMEIARSIAGAFKSNVKNAAQQASGDIDAATSRSLSEYTKNMQLRPTIAIDSTILNDENINKLIETSMLIFSTYYINAVSMNNTINGVTVSKQLGRFSPNRNPSVDIINTAGVTAYQIATSSYNPHLSTESVTLASKNPEKNVKYVFPSVPQMTSKPEVSTENAEVAGDNDMAKNINKAKNIVAGRLITVVLTHNQASVVVNVVLKPVISIMRPNTINSYIKTTKTPATMRERWIAYSKRGLIHSAWDYITCRDAVQAKEKAMVEDVDGYLMKQTNRQLNNRMATLTSGQVSVAEIANTWIVSEDTAKQMAATASIRWENHKARDKAMAELGIMTLIVYNVDYQRVKVYDHGREDVSDVSISQLEKKDEGKMLLEMVTLMKGGSSPIV